MSRWSIALLCALAAVIAPASAQTCAPKTVWTPLASGTELRAETFIIPEREIAPLKSIPILVHAYWCPDEVGAWGHFIHRCVVGRTCLDADRLSAEIIMASRSADWLERLRATIKANESPVLESEKYAWLQAGFLAIDMIRADRPADALWAVAPTTSGQRPSSEVIDGVRVAMKAPVYLASGSACDPGPRPVFPSTGGTWMAAKDQPATLRWLCRRK